MIRACIFVICCFASVSSYATKTYSFFTNSNTYVINQLPQTYSDIQKTLITLGLIDKQDNWSGDSDHLVFLGDINQADGSTPKLLDLFIKLQIQAKKSGGGFHVLMGESELLSLQGEWRHIPDTEINAFSNDENITLRNNAYQQYIQWHQVENNNQNLIAFNNNYPMGLFARIHAFSPDGKYGQWLMNLPFMIKINKQLFVHGGLSNKLQSYELDSLNSQLQFELKSYLSNFKYFIENGTLFFDLLFEDRKEFIQQLENSSHKEQFLNNHKSLSFSKFGPSWYRGNGMCHPLFEEDGLKTILEKLNVTKLWVGHTNAQKNILQSRLSRQLIIMDKFDGDEQTPQYPWVGKIDKEHQITFLKGLTTQKTSLEISKNRISRNPFNMTDQALEDFLLTAKVTNKIRTIEGRTRPFKVTLEKDGQKLHGIFKYKDTKQGAHKGSWSRAKENADRYQYEIAAYKLDRLLNIGLVPVTVERRIDGKRGVIQVWIDGLISELIMDEQDIHNDGFCAVKAQINMMDTFDYLIANKDRNQTNVLYSKDDWQIWFIDHSRAFSAKTRRNKALRKLKIKPTAAFKRALKGLTVEQLDVLRPWLHHRQIDAIWWRREKIIEDNF